MKKRFIAVLCAAAMMASSGMPAYAKTKKTYITPKSATIMVNAKKTIALKNNRKAVKWSASSKNVALSKKSRKGVTVTGKKSGSATVIAKVGKKTYKARISVKKPGLSAKSKTLKKGSSFTLKMSGKKVGFWTISSSKTVLKLTKKTSTSVRVTAVGTGKATVYAETKKPYKRYPCTVTVIGSSSGNSSSASKSTTEGNTSSSKGSNTSSGTASGSSTAASGSTASGTASGASSSGKSSSGTSSSGTPSSETSSSASTPTTHEHTWTPTYKAVYHPAEYRDNVMRARLVPANQINLSATDYLEFPVDANGNVVDISVMTEEEIKAKGYESESHAMDAWIDHCIDDLHDGYSTLIYYLDANGNPTMASKTMVKAAWTEYVIDGYRCTTCGATKTA